MARSEQMEAKLKQLRELYPAGDSLQVIEQLGQSLEALASEREVLEHPIFKKFAATASSELNKISTLLANDPECWSAKGKSLADAREVWRLMFASLSLESRDTALADLDKYIEERLNGVNPKL